MSPGPQFRSHRISKNEVPSQIADLVKAPPGDDKCDAIKRRIVSEETEILELLTGLNLCDQKPSQWFQQLPANVQAIHSISEVTDLMQLSEMADRILNVRELGNR